MIFLKFLPFLTLCFGVLVVSAGVVIKATKDASINNSLDALNSQVAASTVGIVQDAGLAIEEQLLLGVSGSLLPMLHTYVDAKTEDTRPWPYSFSPPSSFANTAQNVHGVPAIVPDMRNPHQLSSSVLISTNSSAVYFSDQNSSAGSLASKWYLHNATIKQSAQQDRLVSKKIIVALCIR